MSKKLQKVFSVTVSMATILMMSGVAALAPLATSAIVDNINEGDTIRVANTFDVYIAKYMGSKQFKRLILNPDVFNSYKHLSWSAVKTVSQATMDQFTTSDLVRALGDAPVYKLTPNGDVGTKQWLNMTAEAFTAGGYDWDSIYVINNVDRDNYTAGSDILAGGATPSPTAVAGSVAVSLASDTPAAATILSYGTGATTEGQALIPALKLNFTAPADGAVTVTALKLTRSGISADSDIDNVYLYDGSSITARLADMQSISTKVISFSNSVGLFTVPAGTTKSIMVRFDVNRLTTSGKTIILSLNSAADVASNAASVSGAFPMTGNSMLTANVTDNGTMDLDVVAGNSSKVSPGTTGFTVASYNLTPGLQDQQLEYIKLQVIGSVAATDISNIKLFYGATQIGTTQQLAADKTVVFDLSSSPLAISSAAGVKKLDVKADVVGGSTRTFYFSVQKAADLIVKDTAYGIYVRPNNGTVGTFSSQSSDEVIIDSGTLAVDRTTDSPTGNIADGATSLTMAKFSMKAIGEDIKVSALTTWCDSNDDSAKIDLLKFFVDGTQVGTTDTEILCDNLATDSQTTTTVNFTVTAGQTKYLTIVGNTTDSTVIANDTVQFNLNIGSSNGQRMSSLGTFNVPTATKGANTLTVKGGTVNTAKNTGMGDAAAAAPTGVVGRTNVKIGSFTITGGAGEDANITKITLSDDSSTSYDMGTDFQNLKIMQGSTQFGSTITNLQTTDDYSYEFSPATTFTITNGQTVIFDVYADILTSAANTAKTDLELRVMDVAATGVSTAASVGDTDDVTLQNIYIATSGTLLIENVAASDQVQANMVYASGVTTNEVELYKFKLTAYTESVDVTRVIISDTITSLELGATTTNGKPTSTLALFKLYEGSNWLGTVTLTATNTPVLGGYLDFNIGTLAPLNIAAGVAKVLTLKATVNDWSQISSGSKHQFTVRHDDAIQDTAATHSISARGHDSSVDLSGPTAAVSATLASNATTARKAYPVVKGVYPGSSETWLKLASGASSGQTIAKFTVSAVGNEIRLKKMTFNIALTDTTTSTYLTLSSFKLYRNGTLLGSTEYDIFDGLGTATANELSNSGTGSISVDTLEVAVGSPNSSSTRAVLIFTPLANLDTAGDTGSGEEIISSGSTNTYEIKCDIAGANHASTDSDSIVTTLLGDDTLTNPVTGYLMFIASTTSGVKVAYRNGIVTVATSTAFVYSNGNNYNFIWSDNSVNVGDHVSTVNLQGATVGGDWATGYEVRKSDTGSNFLPLDSWTLSK